MRRLTPFAATAVAILLAGCTAVGATDSPTVQSLPATDVSSLPRDAAGGYSIVGFVTSGLDALIAQVTSLGARGGAQDGAPVTPVQIPAFTIQ